jgi:phosphoribosylformimino-5-aminoimidazole carboxamide ribotide isomerase
MSTLLVIPAIDVLEGRCVRLSEGRRGHVTVEGGDPAAAAARFAAEGATWLHVVDLDGAFSGRPTPDLVERVVVAAGGVPVQIGGGLRGANAIEAALGAGAARAIVGSVAVTAGTSLSLSLPELVDLFGERLVVAVDARDGKVVADGWTTQTDLSAAELVRRCAEAGVCRLLVTSTRRDGSLAGPDLPLLASVLEVGVPVIAAGGIATLDDLGRLRDLGCEGAVVGSALWSGRFSLADALAYAS